jgi:hypothetical protein
MGKSFQKPDLGEFQFILLKTTHIFVTRGHLAITGKKINIAFFQCNIDLLETDDGIFSNPF